MHASPIEYGLIAALVAIPALLVIPGLNPPERGCEEVRYLSAAQERRATYTLAGRNGSIDYTYTEGDDPLVYRVCFNR